MSMTELLFLSIPAALLVFKLGVLALAVTWAISEILKPSSPLSSVNARFAYLPRKPLS
jgi:hypothetical protein